MLPLYNTPNRPGPKGWRTGQRCFDQRRHLFVLSSLVLMCFTLVLILLLNSEISSNDTSNIKKDLSLPLDGAKKQTDKSDYDEHGTKENKDKEYTEKENKEKEQTDLEKEKHQDKEDKTGGDDIQKTSSENEARRIAVLDAFKHAYHGYKKKCWGQDELRPVSGGCRNWFKMGLTIIDALDTMWIMGLKEDFDEATKWVEEHFSVEQNMEVSVFETNIRLVGGLLSAYDLSKRKIFLDKAALVADKLLPAFDHSPVGIPISNIHLLTGKTRNHGWAGGGVPLADIGTLQMEWTYLSHHTGNPIYAKKALNIYKQLKKNPVAHGALYGVYINPQNGHASSHSVSLGAPSDSLYEYLLKVWVLLNKKISWVGDMWEASSAAILKYMAQKDGDLIYPAQLSGTHLQHRVEQLACFAGGMFALGSTNTNDSKVAKERLDFAAGFTSFCRDMYRNSGSHLSPEFVQVSNGKILLSGDRTFQLRPETIESIFYMWRTTGDQKYRDWSWEIFQSIQQHCKVDAGGYSGITDIHSSNPPKDDMQPSWFLAEVLKYFYLTFADNSQIPLDKYVFNTEAHPLSVFTADPSLYE